MYLLSSAKLNQRCNLGRRQFQMNQIYGPIGKIGNVTENWKNES